MARPAFRPLGNGACRRGVAAQHFAEHIAQAFQLQLQPGLEDPAVPLATAFAGGQGRAFGHLHAQPAGLRDQPFEGLLRRRAFPGRHLHLQELRLGAGLLQRARRPSIERAAVLVQDFCAGVDDHVQQALAAAQPLRAFVMRSTYRAHVPVAQGAALAGSEADARNAPEARAGRAAQPLGLALRGVHQRLRVVVRAFGVLQQPRMLLRLGPIQLQHRGQFLAPHDVVVDGDVASLP
ncbi:hypothetical protein ACFQGW_07950 [Xanthomonas theicola]|uniref:hypothetical protein n=1 Tax=Xanthomonas theicola TaxID=56464 RepID=UPI00361D1C8D